MFDSERGELGPYQLDASAGFGFAAQ